MTDKTSLILVLGSIRSGEYEYLLEQGYQLGILADSNRQVKIVHPELFTFVIDFDFSQPFPLLCALADKISEDYAITAILNLREYYVETTLNLSQKLGLRSMTPHTCKLVTNKILMRRAFTEAIGPDSTIKFIDIRHEEELVAFAHTVGFPIILKPNNLYGSLFVLKINSAAELLTKYRELHANIKEFTARYAIKATYEVPMQAEQFLLGSNHSIDALVDEQGTIYLSPIVDVLTGNDFGLNDFHHFARWSPSRLDSISQQKVIQLVCKGIAALQMTNCSAHVEIIYTPNGPRLLEIAARPGGHRNHVLETTYGIHLIHEYIRLLQGHTPNLTPIKNDGFIIVTPFPHSIKLFKGLHHLDFITKLPTYVKHEIKVKPNSPIGPAKEGFLSTFVIQLSSKNTDAIHHDVKNIAALGDVFI